MKLFTAVKNPKAYVDTSAFIALLDRSDTHYLLFARLFAAPPPLITTSLVIAEGHGWFMKRYNRSTAVQFLNFIQEMKSLDIIPSGRRELDEIIKYIHKYPDQDLTLTDACGLWIMKREKIEVCWSTDRHLGLSGVPLVIHSA